MLQWYLIGKCNDFDENRIYEVLAGRIKVCIINENGVWRSFSRKCPHAGASFVSGWCEGDELVCSFHRHRFNLETGKGCEGQGNFIRI